MQECILIAKGCAGVCYERGMLHVDTFTVLDGTLYSQIVLVGAAKWHQSMDEQSDHPVN